MGAWIETNNATQMAAQSQSHPMWVRGLKRSEAESRRDAQRVAPYVGAWIET